MDEEEDAGVANDESDYPFYACMNNYLHLLYVVKKKELRMYDITKGQLYSIFNNVFNEDIARSEITCFRIDKRHRKAYVANN
jgi:hypothetical protein